MRISYLPDKSAVVVVSQPCPPNEEGDYLPPSDGFKEKIAIDPYKIKVLFSIDKIVRKVAFKFEIPLLVQTEACSGEHGGMDKVEMAS